MNDKFNDIKEYDVLIWPDDRLRLKGEPVTDFNPSLLMTIERMAKTMIMQKGIGLSATQVNIQQRIVVTMLQGCPPLLINPEILEKDGEVVCEEGCLSVPGYYDKVKRANKIKVKYQTETGEEKIEELQGLPAICVQHEIDHLNGVVFVDYVSKIKHNKIKDKIKIYLRRRKNGR